MILRHLLSLMTSQLWNTVFLWQIGVSASFGGCPFHTSPTPFLFKYISFIHGGHVCYQGPTQMNLPFIVEPGTRLASFHGPARSTEKTAEPLSIIIPMGGSGADFAEAGFRMPKPLVTGLHLNNQFFDEGPMIQNLLVYIYICI